MKSKQKKLTSLYATDFLTASFLCRQSPQPGTVTSIMKAAVYAIDKPTGAVVDSARYVAGDVAVLYGSTQGEKSNSCRGSNSCWDGKPDHGSAKESNHTLGKKGLTKQNEKKKQ